MPLQVMPFFIMPTKNDWGKFLYKNSSENADIVGASAEKDLDAWSAEKARLWHTADRRGELQNK